MVQVYSKLHIQDNLLVECSVALYPISFSSFLSLFSWHKVPFKKYENNSVVQYKKTDILACYILVQLSPRTNFCKPVIDQKLHG